MSAKKELAPIPERWAKTTPQEIEVGHARFNIEDVGHGRMAFTVQNGGGPIQFVAPEGQFWQQMNAIVVLSIERRHERMLELVHTLELDAVNLRQELQELEDDRERDDRRLKCAEEKVRRILRYFQHRDRLSDSEVQSITQSIHAGIMKERLKNLISKELTRCEKRVVILYYYEEMTLEEIAATLEMSESRVSQIHSSVVARLKATLDSV